MCASFLLCWLFECLLWWMSPYSSWNRCCSCCGFIKSNVRRKTRNISIEISFLLIKFKIEHCWTRFLNVSLIKKFQVYQMSVKLAHSKHVVLSHYHQCLQLSCQRMLWRIILVCDRQKHQQYTAYRHDQQTCLRKLAVRQRHTTVRLQFFFRYSLILYYYESISNASQSCFFRNGGFSVILQCVPTIFFIWRYWMLLLLNLIIDLWGINRTIFSSYTYGFTWTGKKTGILFASFYKMHSNTMNKTWSKDINDIQNRNKRYFFLLFQYNITD